MRSETHNGDYGHKIYNYENENECEIKFEMKFKMEARVPAVVINVHEVYEQGLVSGFCKTENNERIEIEKMDAFLMFDANVF